MPIVDLEPLPLGTPIDTPKGFVVTPGQDDIDHGSEKPDRSSVLGAAFKQDNTLGAYFASETRGAPDIREDGYNAWESIKGTKYEPHFKSFGSIRNSIADAAMKRQIDNEDEVRKTLDAAPWWQSFPAQLAAGVIDLPTLMPGGAFVRGVHGGFSIGRSALNVGVAAGVSTAAQEAALQSINETRPGAESAINIGASVLLGGLLGAGGAKLLSKGEWNGAVEAINRELAGSTVPAIEAKPIYDDVFKQLRGAGMAEGEASANAAVVAARYATRAERLGPDAGTPFDLYKAEGIDIRRGGDVAALGERTFAQEAMAAPTFYSAVERAAAAAKQPKASADQWLGTLRNTPGVKPEEIEWLGLEDWLKAQPGAIGKAQVSEFIRANKIEVKEVTKGGVDVKVPPFSVDEAIDYIKLHEDRADPRADYGYANDQDYVRRATNIATQELGDLTRAPTTKYSDYQLPGGEKYRELLLTLPEKDTITTRQVEVPAGWGDTAGGNIGIVRAGDTGADYRSSHWEEPNVVAHIRFSDRVIDGKKTLLVEEVQSDWHQAGRDRGYVERASAQHLSEAEHQGVREEFQRRVDEANRTRVPDAPFKTTWPELAMKRMLRYAAENGYERLAWTPGKEQATRYDLSKQVRKIEAIKFSDGTYRLDGVDNGGKAFVLASDVPVEKLPDYIGKDLAEKIAANEAQKPNAVVGYSGVDLKVGGEGMVGFYDDILPKTVNKLVKRYDGKVGRADLDIEEHAQVYEGPVPTVDQIEAVRGAVDAKPTDQRFISPITRERQMFQINRAANQDAFDRVSAAVTHDGISFAEAMERYGSRELAEVFGGALEFKIKNNPANVHTVDITPALKEAAVEKGFALFQGEAKAPQGQITLDQNKAVIALFGKADQSTFMHEAGHLWLDELVRDAAHAKAPAALKDDLATTLKWLGVEDAGAIGRAEHEKWARGFEQYLATGEAPSSQLAKAFANFKQWLTSIYRSLTELGEPVPEDIRRVMDRMLATEADIADRAVPGSGLSSLGAAAMMPGDIAGNSIAGKMAGAVAASTRLLNPALRILQSPSAAVRDVGARLFENSLYMKNNMEGVASPQAVETLMKGWNAGLGTAIKSTDAAFLDYVKGGGQLSRTEFRETVGMAMRRSDEATDPFVAKIAKEWRAKVFDPLKEAAIKAGLLPPDVTVSTASSYFSRMWNINKLIAREGEFKAKVIKWVGENAPGWQDAYDKRTAASISPLRSEIDDLEIAKLRRAEELRRRQQGGELEGGEFTEGDIREALRIVQGGAPRPKGVKTLTQFVAAEGGLFDFGGELAHRGISNRARPGFVRATRRHLQTQGGGWSLDDMTRHAWESGYFPEHIERPSTEDFLNALQDDFFKTRAVLRGGDRDAFQLHELVAQLEQDLARVGVTDTKGPRFSTSDEVKGIVGRVYKALDAEADRKLAALRTKLAERTAAVRIERDARFMGDPGELGRGIADEVFDTLTGKVEAGIRPDFLTVQARGPLKERTFNIPDKLVEDFLENDVELVGRRYTRVMGADVELARKFGSVDLKFEIHQVREDYARLRRGMEDDEARRMFGLRKGFTAEEKLAALGEAEKADVRDLEALRDLLRGTRQESPVERTYGRIVRAANHINYIRSMGEVVLASITDAVRPAMVHGLGQFMTALPQLVANTRAVKLSIAEAQLAGNVLERTLGHRMATVSDLMDPYASRGPAEAFLENMTNVGSKWNGIRMWTDMMKSFASVMTQNRILAGIENFGAIKSSEKAYLAYLGVDQGMAGRILKQFEVHGETIDGVKVANTEKWKDPVVVRAYRAAMNKDVDSIIVQKSVADIPLLANTPTGKLVLQFKSFALASHQKVLLRGLQEDQTRFIGGSIAMTAVGMMITYLKAISGNRPEVREKALSNPGWWVGEGLDRSGIVSVPMELSNIFEKGTGFNPLKTPLKALDRGDGASQKNQNRSDVGSLLGPTAGMASDLMTAGAIPKQLAKGEPVSAGQKGAAERLFPYNSYTGVRQVIRYLVNTPE